MLSDLIPLPARRTVPASMTTTTPTAADGRGLGPSPAALPHAPTATPTRAETSARRADGSVPGAGYQRVAGHLGDAVPAQLTGRIARISPLTPTHARHRGSAAVRTTPGGPS
ncbi:hypothetical protein [Streptomyces sp. x-80]|uniref:hypothetical protein n=1 Tax=Streptomyces sp. x-80 TaxID=2789282 RepID=UPI00398000A2